MIAIGCDSGCDKPVAMPQDESGSEIMDSQDCDETPLTQLSSQRIDDLIGNRLLESKEIEKRTYAALEPMDKALCPIGLHTEFFGFGKMPDFEHFSDFRGLTGGILKMVSRKHCHIERDFCEGKTYLHDTSRFGTFINSEKIGQGNKRILSNGDVISIIDPAYLVYMYIERCPEVHPSELTQLYFISNYVLGEGAMGKVYIGKRRSESVDTVAIKVIPKKKLSIATSQERHSGHGSGSSLELIKREVDIMLNVNHPNCVLLEYVCESSKMAYIVMEYVEGGELFTRIVDEKNSGNGLGEKVTKFYAYQMLQAIDYLHRKGIVHRDIKPENVLLLGKDVYTVVKLSDFGLSKSSDNTMETFCGTQCYMAPELFEAEPHYTSRVDIWSLGVVLFICMVGYPPFSSDYTDFTLKEQICKGRLVFLRVWRQVSKPGQELIRRMLRVNPDARITTEAAMKDIWFDSAVIEQVNTVVQSYWAGRKQFRTRLLFGSTDV